MKDAYDRIIDLVNENIIAGMGDYDSFVIRMSHDTYQEIKARYERDTTGSSAVIDNENRPKLTMFSGVTEAITLHFINACVDVYILQTENPKQLTSVYLYNNRWQRFKFVTTM
jgi:hypothetical protein